MKLLFGVISLILSFWCASYGTWNVYEGPCDWRATAAIVGGWLPFILGAYLALSFFGLQP
jgi:hypothetical protein